jgi:hypothetical protein
VLSDGSVFTTILTSISPDLVAIDSNIENGRELLPSVFQLPNIPKTVTIRDDSTDPLPAGQEQLIRVGTQVSETEW